MVFLDGSTAAAAGKGVRNLSMDAGGYFEADIVWNAETGQWECRPISGGFHAGGGISYSWFVNTMVGPVPVSISLTLGGTIEISIDMQRGTYYVLNDSLDGWNSYLKQTGITTDNDLEALLNDMTTDSEVRLTSANATANDYLTTLRVFLYIRVFAGVGFDYSVVAFKTGVFGQLNVDLNFDWMNRSCLNDPNNLSAVEPLDSRTDPVLAGQEPRFSGSTGVEFLFKFLFISYEQVICSIGFPAAPLRRPTGDRAPARQILQICRFSLGFPGTGTGTAVSPGPGHHGSASRKNPQ